MEQTLAPLTLSQKMTSWLLAFVFLLTVMLTLRHLGSIEVAAPLLVIATAIPLALVNRLFLIFVTGLSFSLDQSSTSTLIQIFTNGRWIFLATCIIVAFFRSVSSKKNLPKLWKTTRWRWVFAILAMASVVYSVSPVSTIERAIALMGLFYVISNLIKPCARDYGAESLLDAILLPLFPLYFISVLVIGQKSSYTVADYTFKSLTGKNDPIAKSLGINPLIGSGRFHGIFQNPNTIGLLSALFFPLILHKVLEGKKGGLYFIYMGILLFVLTLSASREGIFGCIIGGIYVFFRRYGNKLREGPNFTRFLLSLLVISPLLLLALRSEGLTSYLRFGNNLWLAGGRVEAWAAAIVVIASRPFLGHGFGTEALLFKKFGFVFLLHAGDYAHNAYLGLAMQVGIIGSLFFFIPLFRLLFSEFKAPQPSHVRIALQAMLMSGLITCLTESWIYSTGNSQSFPFWAGIGLLEYLKDTESQATRFISKS